LIRSRDKTLLESAMGADAHPFDDTTVVRRSKKKMRNDRCALCRGTRLLCGKARCPIMAKVYANVTTAPLLETRSLAGSSPPSVFVGRYGYPKVDIGPMIPPVFGDTSILDTPEEWVGHPIDSIIAMRQKLVRGKHRVRVDEPDAQDRLLQATREMALGMESTRVDAVFRKRPSGRIELDSEGQPMGPSAPIETFQVEGVKADRRVERAYDDTDLLAREGMLELYRGGVYLSRIQRALSAGLLGEGKRRKLVPTRWSITAVDSTVGEAMMEQTKIAPTIDEFRIYETTRLDNRWVILMMPTEWCYELVEAWYPYTLWNPDPRSISIISDYELYEGRKNYARIGGCYYAARLASNELLTKEGRQAGVVILREAHPGYILPVGVWNVREHVREALGTEPTKYDSLQGALGHVERTMDIPLKRWIGVSGVLKDRLYQRRLEDFT
jgi:hypothetical protein